MWRPAYETKHEQVLRLTFLLPTHADALANLTPMPVAASGTTESHDAAAVPSGTGSRAKATVKPRTKTKKFSSKVGASISTISIRLHQDDTAGETGTTLWLSAQALSCYMAHLLTIRCTSQKPPSLGVAVQHRTMKTDQRLDGRTELKVLELGAGTGLVTLVCAGASKAQVHVIATDVPSVVDGVLKLNLHDAHNVAQMGCARSTMESEVLDWLALSDTATVSSVTSADGGATEEKEGEQGFDYVLGSDLVYSTDSIPALLDAIVHFAKPSQSSASTQTVVVLAQEVRDPDQWAAFCQSASNVGFEVRHIDPGVVRRVVEACLPSAARLVDDDDDGDDGDDVMGMEVEVSPFDDVAIVEMRYTVPAELLSHSTHVTIACTS